MQLSTAARLRLGGTTVAAWYGVGGGRLQVWEVAVR
jgi:hypothetical protein